MDREYGQSEDGMDAHSRTEQTCVNVQCRTKRAGKYLGMTLKSMMWPEAAVVVVATAVVVVVIRKPTDCESSTVPVTVMMMLMMMTTTDILNQ